MRNGFECPMAQKRFLDIRPEINLSALPRHFCVFKCIVCSDWPVAHGRLIEKHHTASTTIVAVHDRACIFACRAGIALCRDES